MRKNQSTEAQRNFILSLARKHDDATVAELLAPAFAINSNGAWNPVGAETLNQALRRLTKTAASKCIDILKAA